MIYDTKSGKVKIGGSCRCAEIISCHDCPLDGMSRHCTPDSWEEHYGDISHLPFKIFDYIEWQKNRTDMPLAINEYISINAKAQQEIKVMSKEVI